MSEVIVRMERVPKNCDDGCWGSLSGECPWCDSIDGYKMVGNRPPNCPIIAEFVRCKECRFHEQEQPGMVYCPNVIGGWTPNDWFCADGERKDVEVKKNGKN